MQTAIHFEGDLAYICVSDQGEIKEEEPVTYGRSRVEFVISTAQAQKEGTIGVVLDEAAPQIVQQAEEQCIRAGITKERVRFFTKEEAALGVVGFRGDNLLRGNSVIFDYTKKRFICYEIRKTKDRVLVDSRDYTEQIKVQNFYLNQKMLFFYGIAFVLLVISLLHIMNSMQYLVAARKHEFGILRAMGITDSGFRMMLLKEGLRYGIYSSILMVAFYLVVQKVLYYFMTHVFLYLHPKSGVQIVPILVMILINMVICTVAVVISGQSVLKEQVVDVIRE